VAFSFDGLRVVTASLDATARVWDALAGRELAVLRGHTAEVTSAAFNPDGSRVVTTSNDGTTCVWDVATGKELVVLRGVGGSEIAAFSDDGTRVVATRLNGSIAVWDSVPYRERFKELQTRGVRR
jgi:WD40 repeat protein